MINKKLGYIILVSVMFFVFSCGINALTCKYSDGKLTATFDVNESKNKAGNATLKGTLQTSDDGMFESDGKREVDETEPVINWDKNYGDISAKGADYYNNHKDCPQYAFLVDSWNGFEFAVFTESHMQEFKDYGESEEGYSIMELVYSSKEPEKDGTDNNYKGGSCMEYTEKTSCEHNNYFACIWNETEYGNYCNTDTLQYVSCGESFDIPHRVPALISFLVNLLKIATPIILIVTSVIALLKSITAQKEDEIKKAQSSLIRKIIAAVMVFIVITIVQFVMIKVADSSEREDMSTCLSCFLNNDCEDSIYYKTNVGGTYICKYLKGDQKTFTCKGNK